MILLDASTPRRFLESLRAWGYDVERSLAHLPGAAADEKVIALAQQLDTVLLSVDLDFSNIVTYPPADYASIIVLRDVPEQEVKVEAVLKQALENHCRDGLRRRLVIVAAKGYRIRQGSTHDTDIGVGDHEH
ncbi:MAG: DUF5615 family PIN-like protein [Anaerolineae bacterium]|nr:DUF5615 family PIN-like protein [Anaerolineae bacterium]NUQ04913.1 DUF5615 family PIN-like protein [Anaerolineae bacterium]